MKRGGQSRDGVLTFTQNQRDEVRELGQQSGAVSAESGSHQQTYLAISIQGNTIDRTPKQNGGGISPDTAHTLNSVDRHGVAYAVDCRNGTESPFVNGTLQAKEQGQNTNSNNIVRVPNK